VSGSQKPDAGIQQADCATRISKDGYTLAIGDYGAGIFVVSMTCGYGGHAIILTRDEVLRFAGAMCGLAAISPPAPVTDAAE
jgi:hypothetical protein